MNEAALLRDAEQVLVGRCMRRHGFRYFVAAQPTTVDELAQRTFPYGIDDVSWAREHGFGDIGQKSPARAKNPNQRYLAKLPAERQKAYLTALYGGGAQPVSVRLANGYTVSASTQGCTASAQAELYGDFRRWFRLSTVVDNLAAEIQPKVIEDDRFRQAVRAWSSCMDRSGEPASDPQRLRERFVEESAGMSRRQANQLQRRLAVAEAHCVTSTGLSAIGRELEREYTAKVRAAHQGEIEAVKTMRSRALGRVRDLAAGRR